MSDASARTRDEDAAIHRSRGTIAAVIDTLKSLGLYQVVPQGQGQFKHVDLDPAQRRQLLVFLSELEEQVKVLEAFKNDLAQDIERADRNTSAAAAYRQTGQSLKKFARSRRH